MPHILSYTLLKTQCQNWTFQSSKDIAISVLLTTMKYKGN